MSRFGIMQPTPYLAVTVSEMVDTTFFQSWVSCLSKDSRKCKNNFTFLPTDVSFVLTSLNHCLVFLDGLISTSIIHETTQKG